MESHKAVIEKLIDLHVRAMGYGKEYRKSFLMEGLEVAEEALALGTDDDFQVLSNRAFFLPTLQELVKEELPGSSQYVTYEQLNPTVKPYWSKQNPTCAYDKNGSFHILVRSSNYLVRQGNYLHNRTLAPQYTTSNDYYLATTRHPLCEISPSCYDIIPLKEPDKVVPPTHDGFEDLRIFFDEHGTLRAIGTKLAGSHTEMWELEIDTDIGRMEIVRQLPSLKIVEKNWAPIVGRSSYVYGYDDGHVRIRDSRGLIGDASGATIAKSFRGSSQFVEIEQGLLGIIHEVSFTPRDHFRVYNHRFVLLNKDDFDMISVSLPFVFGPTGREGERGIEFCAGLSVAGDDECPLAFFTFGFGDMEAWIGALEVDSILSLLRPVKGDHS